MTALNIDTDMPSPTLLQILKGVLEYLASILSEEPSFRGPHFQMEQLVRNLEIKFIERR